MSSETLLHVSRYKGAIVSEELAVSIFMVPRKVEVHTWRYDTQAVSIYLPDPTVFHKTHTHTQTEEYHFIPSLFATFSAT
jgi:hypothetical protein